MSKFSELINGDKPVLVDFHADWCGPCKVLGPIIKEVAGVVGDKVKILKVDVDKNQAASIKYGIKGVPTMILFKKGEIVWRQSGVVPKEEILKVLESNM